MLNKTINGYTIKRLIGSGGMSDVYYAENRLGKKAAIKMLKPELCAFEEIRNRFEQEARIMVEIEHGHICQAYDLGEIDNRPAIIMEYLEGQTLKEAIGNGKIGDDKARKYFEHCVSALRLTQAKDIVHRDIKPSNIIITVNDEAKILDFGIAKVKESSLGTKTNQMLGTPVYMSPEQIRSPKNVGTKSDVYSLAVTFYHALTGKVPYDSSTDSDFEIQSKIVHEDLDLSQLSSSWSATLRSMMVKDASLRFSLTDVSIGKQMPTQDIQQYSGQLSTEANYHQNSNRTIIEDHFRKEPPKIENMDEKFDCKLIGLDQEGQLIFQIYYDLKPGSTTLQDIRSLTIDFINTDYQEVEKIGNIKMELYHKGQIVFQKRGNSILMHTTLKNKTNKFDGHHISMLFTAEYIANLIKKGNFHGKY